MNKNTTKKSYLKVAVLSLSILTGILIQVKAQTIATFENIQFNYNAYYNGKDLKGNFKSGGITFQSKYDTTYKYWSAGFAGSSVKDSITAGFTNQYASRAGAGYQSNAYAVANNNSYIKLAKDTTLKGFYISNSTYAALSMKNGDAFAKKFGDTTNTHCHCTQGSVPDFFKLVIYGYDKGAKAADSVEFYLADFRDANNSKDYIVNNWKWVDLTSLGKVDSLTFGLRSSDVGTYGMNTPAYFCIDNFTTPTSVATFEQVVLSTMPYYNGIDQAGGFSSGNVYFPTKYSTKYGGYWSGGFSVSSVTDSITAGFTNLYAAITNSGDSSKNYAVVQNNAVARLTGVAKGQAARGVYVTNATYAALSMKNGDAFAKKFGGATGNDQDFFKLTVKGFLNGTKVKDTVDFYLADYRNPDNTKDYIVKNWRYVDLTNLGKVDSVQFSLSSSDVGAYGMNTPAYFCIDNFTTSDGVNLGIVGARAVNAGIQLYPNPTKDVLFLNLPETLNNKGAIQIYDMKGQLALNIAIAEHNAIDVSRLAKGVYVVRIANTGVNVKFVKQ